MVFPEPEVTCANTNCVELEVIKMPNAVSDVTAQVAVTATIISTTALTLSLLKVPSHGITLEDWLLVALRALFSLRAMFTMST